jgi:hypothetical protein
LGRTCTPAGRAVFITTDGLQVIGDREKLQRFFEEISPSRTCRRKNGRVGRKGLSGAEDEREILLPKGTRTLFPGDTSARRSRGLIGEGLADG